MEPQASPRTSMNSKGNHNATQGAQRDPQGTSQEPPREVQGTPRHHLRTPKEHLAFTMSVFHCNKATNKRRRIKTMNQGPVGAAECAEYLNAVHVLLHVSFPNISYI